MRHFVTLFDSNYLARGLVLYHSLLRHAGDFHLWIICFDTLAYQLLQALHLEKGTAIPLAEFEDDALLQVKPQRTWQEYCWTSTPSTLLYVLNIDASVDAITYLDADLMFFSSPEPIFHELADASIALTAHRYLPEYSDCVSTNGLYNVQFMMFRRTADGLQALQWWRERCLEWCFARSEDNKFGDQKYLDDWPSRFRGVHILCHLGAGLAPWNAAQYALHKIGNTIYVNNDPLIFYHFHGLFLYPFKLAYLYRNYPINKHLRNWIYKSYLQDIKQAYQEARKINPTFNSGLADFPKIPWRPLGLLHSFSRQLFLETREGRYCWNL